LKNIEITQYLTTVGDNAFNGCDHLNPDFVLELKNRFGERVFEKE